MNIQDFCEHLHIILKNELITPGSDIERLILDKLINLHNPDLKNSNPIYTCLASQTYEHFTKHKLVKMSNQAQELISQSITERSSQDHFRESIWNSFLASVEHVIIFYVILTD